MDETVLIARLTEGDPEVVAQVRVWIRAAFTPYRERLAADLEDMEQEILLDLIRALREERFRGQSQFSTYVRTYAHHKCIDRLRILYRRQWVDIGELDLPSPQPSALEEMARTETVDQALRILEAMPESCRELWRMLAQGMSYREMSRQLGVAEGALRARVLRCRRRALEMRARLFVDEGSNESGPTSTK